jgi:thiosulfate/3-mercaptopyruvate sulfurtransferase
MVMMKPLRIALATLTLLLAPVWSAAQSLVVDTPYVEQALKSGALVWDARNADDYAKGHIPGAVNIGFVGELFRDPNREDPPSAAAASKIFGGAGMDVANKEVIVYTNRGDSFAYYGARMIEYYGGKHAKVYHGGIEDWLAADKRVVKEPTKLAPVALTLPAEGQGAVSTKDVIERARAGNVQLLDVRTAKEFSGEDIRAIRGGHIAGAINIPYEQNWKDPATPAKLAAKQVGNSDGMALKGTEELKALYARLDPAKETIVYCQSGVRASESAVVLRQLGFSKVKVYESSWLGYAGVLSAPAEDEVFVNIGALNGRIGSLQNRVKELEAEVSVLRGQGKR